MFLLSCITLVGATRPNIVFILVDDLGYQDVGFNGSTFYETPRLDALAKESLVLENSYMYPSCSPSRTALATGKHSFRTQVYRVPVTERGKASHNLFSKWTVDESHRHYAQVLNEVGYKLIHLGKWHLVGPDPIEEMNTAYPYQKKLTQRPQGDLSWVKDHQTSDIQKYYPLGRGYHENVGGTWWGDPARGAKSAVLKGSGGYKAPFHNPFMDDKQSDEWLTDRLTNDAIDFMERNKAEAFFVSLHYYTVHRPSIFRNNQLRQKYLKKPECKVTGQSAEKKKELAAFATMVENMDENVGRIMDYLDKSGLRENTIVFFTSDNGFNNKQSFNKNMRGFKFTFYEGGMKVPTLINWPGKVKPRRDKSLNQCIDYFPTFMELAGIADYRGQLDGVSLVPLLKGEKLERSEALYWHLPSGDACTVMRKGKWKLIQYHVKNKVELYDLENDPVESQNLFESQTEKAIQLIKEMTEWRRLNKVPLPEASHLDV